MSDSALATIRITSPNSRSRLRMIDTITIHHAAAVGVTARQIGEMFSTASRKASSNYGIGNDGSIGIYVPESMQAITSSSSENDQRAVTIEVANCGGAPDWPVSSAAYASLILLVTDICRRNKIPKLLWCGDKSLIGQPDKQNMTVHRWFAATACPGDYLYNKMGEIAAAVNARLGPEEKLATEKRYHTIEAMPSWAQPTIRDLCSRGILEGKNADKDAQGYPARLDLSEDMLRILVINDRAGVYGGGARG